MPDAFEAGVSALDRRELSRAELAMRLARAGFDREDADRAVERLAEAGYQSDGRAAAERARTLASRRYGDVAIRVDLRRRGIGDDDVEAAIHGITPEAARAAALADRTPDPTRLLQALRRKGFSEDAVEAALQTPGLRR